MKIGVSSYSFLNHMDHTGADYLEICGLAAQMGFEGIEFIDLDPARQGVDSEEAAARAIRRRCDELGLPVAAYTVHADLIEDPDPAEKLRRRIDIAALLGAGVLRHDVTWRRDIPWRTVIGRTRDIIREVTDYAAARGIRTCTENHGYVMQDANRVEELILAVDRQNFGWLVDIGNFLCADEWPLHALPIAAPYAFHAHAKDFLLKREPMGEGWIPTRNGDWLRGTVPGHGVVPVRECIGILKKSGYDGWLSLEFEGMEENLPALRSGLDYLKRCLAE